MAIQILAFISMLAIAYESTDTKGFYLVLLAYVAAWIQGAAAGTKLITEFKNDS
tara:strand:- start:7613 stop:7774 length:162 start_codon:yes stop_codon:yes gene_type:complete